MHIGRVLWPRRFGGKLIVLACAFVVVLIGVYQFAVWSLSRQLGSLLESDRRAGLPTTIAEAYGPAVPDSENAEEPLLAAGRIAEEIHRQAMREVFGSETPPQYSVRDPKYISKFGGLAEANAEFVADMAEAERRPFFKFASRPEDSRIPVRRSANLFGHAIRAEAARAMCESNAGNRDAALERLIRLYRFARRGYEAAPFFDWWNIVNNGIRGEVHWAIDQVLISGVVSDHVRDALDEALSHAEDNLRSAAIAQQGQKLFLLNGYQTYGETPQFLSKWSTLRVIDLLNRIEVAETMTKFAPRKSVSGKSALDVRRRLMKERGERSKSRIYSAMYEPAYVATLNETSANYIPFREIAVARCLRVLNAHQRLMGKDAWSIVSPQTVFTDPFTEEPLRMIQTKSGWVVYSLGESQKDTTTEGDSLGNYVVGNVHELPKRKK